MKKVIFTMFLSLFFLVITVAALADENDTYIYSSDDNGNVTIQGYKSDISGDYTIPSEIEGKTVTGIAGFVFKDCDITSLTIPSTIQSIGSGAFSGCTSLQSIILDGDNQNFIVKDGVLFSRDMKTIILYPASKTNDTYSIPDTVETIGSGAFGGSNSLKKIKMPATLSIIDDRAFYQCSNLENIDLSKIIYIGDSAFYGCSQLKSIKLCSNISTLDCYAFENCTSLSEVVIPDSIAIINEGVFRGCTSLINVTLGASTELINYQAFYGCTSLTQLVIPDSVTMLAESCFAGCTALSSVNISSSLTDIGDTVFQGCSSLELANFLGEVAPQQVGADIFADSDNVEVSFPNSETALSDFEQKAAEADAALHGVNDEQGDYDNATSSDLSQNMKFFIVIIICVIIVAAAIILVVLTNREKDEDYRKDKYISDNDENNQYNNSDRITYDSDAEDDDVSKTENEVIIKKAFEHDMSVYEDILNSNNNDMHDEDKNVNSNLEKFNITNLKEEQKKAEEINNYISSVEINGQVRKRRRQPGVEKNNDVNDDIDSFSSDLRSENVLSSNYKRRRHSGADENKLDDSDGDVNAH